ncbi:hypothetical protein BUALT_Bualt19G0040200 [Buddleja alternifolia]|uniref:Uncharacterized protein n=1 Tax=Buddleja alternifolia TaxID=168488 RepID=A0AAV6W986_9LAMI|nr:hypothetical protein BUALT_Bualt19G0040200 [Buddleja alternifolia]
MDSFTSSMRNPKSFCSVNNKILDVNSASRSSVESYSEQTNNSDPVRSAGECRIEMDREPDRVRESENESSSFEEEVPDYLVTRSSIQPREFDEIRERYHIPVEFKLHLPGSWKEKFFFVEPPRTRPWRMAQPWRLEAPNIPELGEATFEEGFIENTYARTWYLAKKMVLEPILATCALSPANVELVNLAMATRKAEVAKNIEAQMKKKKISKLKKSRLGAKAPLRKDQAPRRILGDQPTNDPSRTFSLERPQYQLFDDKANEEAQASAGLGQKVPLEISPLCEIPLTADVTGNGSDAVHSTNGGEDRDQAFNPPARIVLGKRKAVEAPFREGSSGSFRPIGGKDDHLKGKVAEIEELLAEDRREAYTRGGKVLFAFDGESWDPKWKVSSESSIFEMGAGGTSFELYKACMLPRDKARFIDAPHPNVEHGAHSWAQTGLAMHQLSLSNSYWKNEKLVGNAEISSLRKAKEKLDADLVDAKGALRDALLRFDEIEARHTTELDAKDKLLVIEKQKFIDLQHEMSNLHAQLREETKKEKEVSFKVGLSKGVDGFLRSEDYEKLVKKHRHDGAKDFKQSTIFQKIMLNKASSDTLSGFTNCKRQFFHLGGIKKGFDLKKLDPCMISEPIPGDDDDDDDEEGEGDVEMYVEFDEFRDLAPTDASDEDDDEAN